MNKDTLFKKMEAIRRAAVKNVPSALSNTQQAVKKVVGAPVKLVKKQWNKNQAFRNKNSTKEKFEQNSK